MALIFANHVPTVRSKRYKGRRVWIARDPVGIPIRIAGLDQDCARVVYRKGQKRWNSLEEALWAVQLWYSYRKTLINLPPRATAPIRFFEMKRSA